MLKLFCSPFESSLFVPIYSESIENYEYQNSMFLLLFNNNTIIVFFISLFLSLFLFYMYSDKIVDTFLFSYILVPIYKFCHGLSKTYVFRRMAIFFPFILFLFFFLINANLIGMIPFNFAITSHLSLTFLLAFSIWCTVITLSFFYSGLSFLSHFLIKGIPNTLVPMLLVIELISFFIRVISLSLRLFANIFSGHILLHVISSALYEFLFSISSGFDMNNALLSVLCFVFYSILVIFEIMVGILQAYIFVLLSLIYLSEV